MNVKHSETVLFITLLLTVSIHAKAQQSPQVRSPQENPAAEHCVARAELLGPGASDSSNISNLDCYSSFSEAIYAATNGSISLPPDESFRTQLKILGELTSAEAKSTSGSGQVILAIDYIDSIYRGSTLTYLGNTTCSSTTSYQFPFLPASFNDEISSSRAFGGCSRNIFYEHINYGGAVLTCTPSCVGLGVMNDAASSRRMEGVCAEASCVYPDGSYISHFTGANCDGTESYYLPYDFYGYQCRPDSSAGAQCGTIHRTVTNRSYRYGGHCYDNAWPDGNTLDDFVTVYR